MRTVRDGNDYGRTVDGSSGRFITRRLRFVTVAVVFSTSHLHAS
jgi:hypothetical protein